MDNFVDLISDLVSDEEFGQCQSSLDIWKIIAKKLYIEEKEKMDKRYKFYQHDNVVVAVSSYAGRKVRASAKCNPKDEFDLKKGKKLAKLRCDQKIAHKRWKRASAKVEEAQAALVKAKREYNKMISYYSDSMNTYNDLTDKLEDLEINMAFGR